MSSIVISGNTSGSVTLDAPAVSGSTTYTLAAVSGTISPLVSGTAQASTSGTSIDFTGIPSWVKRITVMFSGMSTSGTSSKIIQIGSSGGLEITGYLSSESNITGAVGTSNVTNGFGIRSIAAADLVHGTVVLTNLSGNIWSAFGLMALSNTSSTLLCAGSKTLSATLDRVRITTVNGTDTFDAGSINIMYE